MAGTATAGALLRADNAASDAAADAHAEALRRDDQAIDSPARSKRTQRRLERQSTTTDGWHRFVVDIWITNLNTTEFGVYKRSRNRAKSRQFSTDMDIFAEVIEDGRRTGLLGYRQDLWGKNAGLDKRLVFKLFSDKLNWRATMDLMLARSLQQTIGARGLPVMTYSINTDDHSQVVYVERSANKWPLLPENFSFFLLEDGKVDVYRVRQDLIRFGDDYTVYNAKDEPIGRLDGAVFSLGGIWRCKLKRQYADKRLLAVLKMFAGMLIFNDDCRRHVARLSRQVRAGKYQPRIEKQESDLYMNPRRVR